MKRISCAMLLAVTLATPAFAVDVYLKDGGVIQAKKVWREGAKVHVLATRHTETVFEKTEIDLKRTFVKRHRAAKRVTAVKPQVQTITTAPDGAVGSQKQDIKKSRINQPNLPKLSERSPDSLVPSSGGGGTIKQHKKDMAEKVAE